MKNYITLLSILFTILGCGGERKVVPPVIAISAPAAMIKPIYNVYVENSASMNGYINGPTEFKSAVHNFLANIKIFELTDSLNLNFINSQIVSYGIDINRYIDNFEPAMFQRTGGNIGTTDIADMLKMVLNKACENFVSILISDFIFSPGRGRDAGDYLERQQIRIKNIMADHLKNFPEQAVIIYQLESRFRGSYYNKLDNVSQFEGNRPYYIWIIGNRKFLSNLISKCHPDNFMGGGVKNIFSITKEGPPIKYAVQLGSGNFKLDKNDPQKSIVQARKDIKGIGEKKLRFNVNVDLSDLLLSDSYLLDKKNYYTNDKDYKLEVHKIHSKDYSHTLKLSTSIVKPSNLSIKLKNQIPPWVDDLNDDLGIDINAIANKTFGFKYLVNGIYDAFTINGACCLEIKVKVNQK